MLSNVHGPGWCAAVTRRAIVGLMFRYGPGAVIVYGIEEHQLHLAHCNPHVIGGDMSNR